MKELLNSTYGLKDLPKILEADVVDLCQLVFNGGFRHHHNIIRHTSDTDCISLASTYLKPKFRYGKGCYYISVRDTYFDCIDDSYSYGDGTNYTKAYEMKPWVYDTFYERYSSPQQVTFTQYHEREIMPITAIPNNAVSALDSESQPSATNFKLQPMIPFDRDQIERLI